MADKKDERVLYTLPLLDDPNAPQTEYFALNFVGYTLERGVPVSIPKALYEIIKNGEKERNRALAYAKKMALQEPSQQTLTVR